MQVLCAVIGVCLALALHSCVQKRVRIRGHPPLLFKGRGEEQQDWIRGTRPRWHGDWGLTEPEQVGASVVSGPLCSPKPEGWRSEVSRGKVGREHPSHVPDVCSAAPRRSEETEAEWEDRPLRLL